ncbi:unnamed protein product [Cylicostephanus goldi]|uniref:PDZ domain-containing protein n=1 Tax=Cylicostephanus goldi TaxID=71465 RepID=A0A3P6S6Z7_CYLGO|nr:unnamed protein product [Cylicostephanus goldi]
MKPMDRIIDVNGVPVKDKDLCKKLVLNNLVINGEANMIVERPVETAAVAVMAKSMAMSQMQPPSLALPDDVKSILRRYNEKLKQGQGKIEPFRALVDPNNPNQVIQHPKREAHLDPTVSHISVIIPTDDESRLNELVVSKNFSSFCSKLIMYP